MSKNNAKINQTDSSYSAFDYCPICHLKWQTQCKCLISERTCANNHTWFHCPIHHTLVVGESKHGLGMNVCQCKDHGLSADNDKLKNNQSPIKFNSEEFNQVANHPTKYDCTTNQSTKTPKPDLKTFIELFDQVVCYSDDKGLLPDLEKLVKYRLDIIRGLQKI